MLRFLILISLIFGLSWVTLKVALERPLAHEEMIARPLEGLKQGSSDPRSMSFAMERIVAASRKDGLSKLIPGDGEAASSIRHYVSITLNDGTDPSRAAQQEHFRALIMKDMEASFEFARGALRALPEGSAHDERRILVDLFHDTLARHDPRETAAIAFDLLASAARQPEGGRADTDSRPYAAVDAVYQAQLLLFSLPLEPKELLVATGDAARRSNDAGTQLLLARHFLSRFPELSEQIRDEAETWGLQRGEI